MRTGRDFDRYFPEITAAGMQLPPCSVIDGKLVAFNGQRVDFALLQRRIARPDHAYPTYLVCFDLLEHPGPAACSADRWQNGGSTCGSCSPARTRIWLLPAERLVRPGRRLAT